MKIAVIGHSHINCMKDAAQRLMDGEYVFTFVQFWDPVFKKEDSPQNNAYLDGCDQELIESCVVEASKGAALTVLCPSGNEHNVAALLNVEGKPLDQYLTDVATLMRIIYSDWLIALSCYIRSPAVVIPPPPPIESEKYILENPGEIAEALAERGLTPAHIRLQAWLKLKQMIKRLAADCGLRFLDLPEEIYATDGFLHERFYGNNPTHANEAYGEMLLCYISHFIKNSQNISRDSWPAIAGAESIAYHQDAARNQHHEKRQHPYVGLPDRAFWKQAVSQIPSQLFDPIGEVPFRILRSDKVATAGSCFAQHISKRIRSGGFQFLVTERPFSDTAENCEARGFYDFSARYGNIYTARQLLQLFDRAFGYFSPLDNYWITPDNKFCDPFRPRIEPHGFSSVAALEEDRRRHLAAVREMFEQLDIFVFTLGLTECWLSRLDGAAYPLAPGVAGGEYDPLKYEFKNFGVDEVVKDLQAFVHKLRLVNPNAKLILTVSPVPLAATYDDNHVLVATTYSKAVLRVAADMISRSFHGIYYFPSYEMINGNYNRGSYFGSDLRTVTAEGVDHVMAVFMRHLTKTGEVDLVADLNVDGQISVKQANFTVERGSDFVLGDSASIPEIDEETAKILALSQAICDEEVLARK